MLFQNPRGRISIEAISIEAAIETTLPAVSAVQAGWGRDPEVAAKRLDFAAFPEVVNNAPSGSLT